ncbi:SPOR domain-containing protein [Rhodanobacter sp. DHG33]|uniref:SPOR domain-containing protein n=1 Tax=Rhodanobacter sp. DHG33 TaxID=2775921 RepID=UPI001784A83A|nr:SPOR domain-containing protein [Rhodanobacter sp. DHG33]MBD8898916.1 SPOR domain-containing protein [Rhodanobacter sp. DHG33]
MFLRLLFVLLVMLNIVAGAWLLLGQPYAHVPMATDPGVPELHLLSELPAQAATTEPAAGVATSATPAPAPAATNVDGANTSDANAPVELRCLTLGPFATPHDLQQARTALTPVTRRMRSRQEQVAQSRSWWVYLPASGSRAQALALTKQLAAHGINDYFVVGGGDQPNTVSLGLFKDQDNARKRRTEVATAGFAARIAERTETVPQYWLDLVAEGRGFDWHRRIRSDGVGSHSTSCF